MKRTTMLAATAAAALTARVPAAAQPVSRKVSIAVLGPSAASWASMAAADLGYFARYGIDLDPVVVQSTAAAAQQTIAGAVDCSEISTSQLIESVIGGADLRHVCSVVLTPPYALVAQKSVKKYADLKGKTIVVGGINDMTRIFAEKMIETGGLAPSDYDETYAGATTERYAALHSGSVAAAILFPPWDFRAADEGFTSLGVLNDAMPPFPYTGLTFRDAFAKAHPGIVTDMLRSYLHGVRFINDPANKAKAIDILATRTKAAPAEVAKTYDELIAKYKVFPSDGVLNAKAYSSVVDMLGKLAVVKPPLPAGDRFFDRTYLDSALAQLARERA